MADEKYDVKKKLQDDIKYLEADKKNWTENKKDSPVNKEKIAVIDAKIKLTKVKIKQADAEINDVDEKGMQKIADEMKKEEENVKKAEEALKKKQESTQKEATSKATFSERIAKLKNFGSNDNYGDTQNVDNINREEVFQAGMSMAHEIFGDDTNEKIVWDMVGKAIDEAMAKGADTNYAIDVLKTMFTKTYSNFSAVGHAISQLLSDEGIDRSEIDKVEYGDFKFDNITQLLNDSKFKNLKEPTTAYLDIHHKKNGNIEFSPDDIKSYMENNFSLRIKRLKDFSQWSGDVETKWTPPEGLFEEGSAEEIADAEFKGHKDLKSAMASINFYLNRGGSNISEKRRNIIEQAKEILREKYSKDFSMKNFSQRIKNLKNFGYKKRENISDFYDINEFLHKIDAYGYNNCKEDESKWHKYEEDLENLTGLNLYEIAIKFSSPDHLHYHSGRIAKDTEDLRELIGRFDEIKDLVYNRYPKIKDTKLENFGESKDYIILMPLKDRKSPDDPKIIDINNDKFGVWTVGELSTSLDNGNMIIDCLVSPNMTFDNTKQYERLIKNNNGNFDKIADKLKSISGEAPINIDEWSINFSESISKCIVTYEDEDGQDTAEFDTEKEADKWIEACEGRVSSGEKFKFIKKECINMKKNFSENKWMILVPFDEEGKVEVDNPLAGIYTLPEFNMVSDYKLSKLYNYTTFDRLSHENAKKIWDLLIKNKDKKYEEYSKEILELRKSNFSSRIKALKNFSTTKIDESELKKFGFRPLTKLEKYGVDAELIFDKCPESEIYFAEGYFSIIDNKSTAEIAFETDSIDDIKKLSNLKFKEQLDYIREKFPKSEFYNAQFSDEMREFKIIAMIKGTNDTEEISGTIKAIDEVSAIAQAKKSLDPEKYDITRTSVKEVKADVIEDMEERIKKLEAEKESKKENFGFNDDHHGGLELDLGEPDLAGVIEDTPDYFKKDIKSNLPDWTDISEFKRIKESEVSKIKSLNFKKIANEKIDVAYISPYNDETKNLIIKLEVDDPHFSETLYFINRGMREFSKKMSFAERLKALRS